MREFKSFFKVVGGNEGSLCRYNSRLDTYGCGCAHDCSYCYAKSLLSFRGLWHSDDPAVAPIDKIARKIGRLEKGSIVRLGGMTDCLQPCEAQHKVTLQTIRLLNAAGIGYLIVTKSHLIAQPEYADALDPALAHVQITVTNTDDRAALAYEKASLSHKRLEAVKILQERGIDVALRLSPFVEEFIDIETIQKLAPKKIILEFLRVNHWVEKWLDGLIDLTPYSHKHGGYRHLPLDEKRVQAFRLKEALPGAEISVCEDVPEDFAWWGNFFNPNTMDCCNLRK